MRPTIRTLLRLTPVSALAALLLAAPVAAEEGPDGSAKAAKGDGPEAKQAEANEAPSKTVSDAQLNKFAAAYMDVQRLQSQYGQQIQQAKTPDEAQRLQAEANDKLMAAVRSQGLTPEEYDRIGRQAMEDEVLRGRLQKVLQSMAPAGGR